MAQILITSTSFVNTPYNTYVCDVYGNQCVLVANVITGQPPTLSLTLPPQFNTAPAVGVKIIDSLGCEVFKILDCTQETITPKQFQDFEYFYFMDNTGYDFQN